MIRKLKKTIKTQIRLQNEVRLQLLELEWANIYHDSIRGKKSLEQLSLNIGRWAGNYTFFYLLNRILNDFKPKQILEFGLGESTKFIITYINNYLNDSELKTIEHDEKWRLLFFESFTVNDNIDIEILKLTDHVVNGYKTHGYLDLCKKINRNFDLYIVDGPFGSNNYSRYDIVYLMENVYKEDEFIILLDDYHRKGEKETAKVLLNILDSKGIVAHTREYVGNKTVYVIATNKYRYAVSL
ncbi:hypothetical protein SAMN05421824_1143 [Hyunsoonleella jejuensis]|uniref:Methyltransferase domain-containing protein n=1 Tax=Hyunsoonleella jejuensis TaxID=419940 RepID=A0A1H9D779_9FLAO|nr:hypothetical protein [Hyunsoonleella jejuensis]SEQ09231.1 hypothetical protein SAMN05421824_1143 [Hyunsoonleella jejuensis]